MSILPNNSKRTLTLKKVNINDKEHGKLKTDLTKLFTEPSLYFNTDNEGNQVIIGKKQNFPRYSETGSVVPYCYVGGLGKHVKKALGNIMNTESRINQSYRSFCGGGNNKNKGIQHKNYQVINDNQLGDLIESHKKRIETNHKEGHNRFISEIPYLKGSVLQKFMLQEKALTEREKSDGLFKQLEYKIAQKSKKSINALLMKSVGNNTFRMKKETVDALKKEIHFTRNDWMRSLRDKDTYIGRRHCFIRRRNELSPVYGIELEPANSMNEYIRDPEYDYESECKTLKTNEYLKTCSGFDRVLKTTTGFRNLSIKGRDLLQAEYDSAKMIRGNKRLIKKNEDEIKNECKFVEQWGIV